MEETIKKKIREILSKNVDLTEPADIINEHGKLADLA